MSIVGLQIQQDNMPTYYDPVSYKKLQALSAQFYEAPEVDHLDPLKHLSPLNLESLTDSSPVKILKFGSRALKIFKKLSGLDGGAAGEQQLDDQKKEFDSVDNISGKIIKDGENGQGVMHNREGSDSQKAMEDYRDQFNIVDNESTKTLRKDRAGNYQSKSPQSQVQPMLSAYGKEQHLTLSFQNSGIKIYALGSTLQSKLNPYLVLPFIPDNIEIKTNSTFAKINILNRNNVPYQFINGSEEITMTINWYDPGVRLGKAYVDAKKMQMLTLMDGSKFPRKIFFEWGSQQPLFDGLEFYVKSARMKLQQFHTARPSSQDNKNPGAVKGMRLPARVEQEVTLIRIEKAGYWTHQKELNRIKAY